MCHQLNLSLIDIEFELKLNSIWIRSIVKTKESTGVEMEALSAVSIALLAVYDMCKAVDKTMTISGVKLIEKIEQENQFMQPNIDPKLELLL